MIGWRELSIASLFAMGINLPCVSCCLAQDGGGLHESMDLWNPGVTTRQPTPEEQQTISARTRPDYASYGCLVVLSAGTAWVFGILGRWLGSFVSTDVSTYAQWAGWCAGAALAIPILAALIPYDRRQRQLASRDNASQVVHALLANMGSAEGDKIQKQSAFSNKGFLELIN